MDKPAEGLARVEMDIIDYRERFRVRAGGFVGSWFPKSMEDVVKNDRDELNMAINSIVKPLREKAEKYDEMKEAFDRRVDWEREATFILKDRDAWKEKAAYWEKRSELESNHVVASGQDAARLADIVKKAHSPFAHSYEKDEMTCDVCQALSTHDKLKGGA